MWDKFIGEQVRRANRNLLLINVVLLLFAGSMVLSQHRTISGYVRGGQQIDAATLASAMPLEHTVVQVDSDNVIPTGYEMVKEEYGKKTVEYEYLAMKAGDRMMLVKVDPGKHGPHFEGYIAPLPSDVSNALAKDVKSDRVRAAIMPMMLDTIEYKSEAWMLMGFGIPAILIAVWNLKKWMQRASDPEASPIVTQLEHRGGVMACQQIDSEVAQSSGKIGKAILTRSCVITPHFFHVSIMHLDDVVWVYKKVTQHRVNFIPTGKTYAAMLCAANGQMVQVDGKQDKIDQLLLTIATKAPWAITGFSADIQTMWDKKRDALLQAVNQRRSEVMKKMAQAATASKTPVPTPAPA